MNKYRENLPQLRDQICLTDGGLETVLIFQQGIELPGFASFTLLDRADGSEILRNYMEPYIAIAHQHKFGLLLESPTWRASSAWGDTLGYDGASLDAINRQAIELMEAIRLEHETETSPMPISGCIGPRGDGYTPSAVMTADEAMNYHQRQVQLFADSAADLVSALTLNYCNEAIGLTRAAQAHEIPVAISFTVETDGRLPSGESLGEAIERCDRESDGYAAYFMINCAHPLHFQKTLRELGSTAKRIGGVRANASKLSHAELDNSSELDRGCPDDLAREMLAMRSLATELSVFGGCCGTDHEHIARMAEALRR